MSALADGGLELDTKLHEAQRLLVECAALANSEALRAPRETAAQRAARDAMLVAAGEVERSWRLLLQAIDRRAEVVRPIPDGSDEPF